MQKCTEECFQKRIFRITCHWILDQNSRYVQMISQNSQVYRIEYLLQKVSQAGVARHHGAHHPVSGRAAHRTTCHRNQHETDRG